MGGLFSCVGHQQLPDVYIDFSNVQPSCNEEQVITDVFKHSVMDKSNELFSRFVNYKNSQTVVSLALSTPTEQLKNDAWESIIPSIKLQSELYDFALLVVDQFTVLLEFVMNLLHGNSIEILDKYPAITKSFADCFNLILRLDEIKLNHPEMGIDISFFRRVASRRYDFEDYLDLFQKSASIIQFFGTASPCLEKVIKKIESICSDDQEKQIDCINVFASIVDICTAIMSKHRFEDDDTNLMVLRCMTCGILIVDHISPNGSFTANSPVQIVPAIEIINSYIPSQDHLIGVLRYSSKHLYDQTSLAEIKNLMPAQN